MASLKFDRKQRQGIIRWRDGSRRHRSIRLKDVSKTFAERFVSIVERLDEARRTQSSLDNHLIEAINGLADVFYDKLVKVDLIEPRAVPESEDAEQKPECLTLAAMIDGFIERRVDVKESTKTSYRQTKASLVQFFKAKKPIDEITPGDCEDWARWMKAKAKLAPATVYRRISWARTFFRDAVKHKLIDENPFVDVRAGQRTNRDRLKFVTRDEIDRVLEQCPDAEWRLLVCLSRFGGLRTPSESLTLRWSDVDWHNKRIRIDSPKTGLRDVPLFSELVEPLRECWELFGDQSEFVLSKHRPAKLRTSSGNWAAANFRTTFAKIIKRAGLTPWTRLWHNLRASRQTELCDSFPSHVVSSWLGNSERVANLHYLQTTDEHWERAVSNSARTLARTLGAESGSTGSQAGERFSQTFTSMQRKTATRENVRPFDLGDEGLRP